MTLQRIHVAVAMAVGLACAAPGHADPRPVDLASNPRLSIATDAVDDDVAIARARSILAALDEHDGVAAGDTPAAPPDTATDAQAQPTSADAVPPATGAFKLPPLDDANEDLPLGGAPPQTAEGDKRVQSNTSGSWILQTLSALGVVIALILALRYLLQRMSGQPRSSDLRGVVNVLGRAPIAPRTHVLFLRLNQRVIVVGQTPSGLNTLADLDDPEEVAWLIERVETNRSGSITEGFRHLLSRMDRDYHPDADLSDEGHDDEEHYLDRTRDGVSGLLSRMRALSDSRTRGGDR